MSPLCELCGLSLAGPGFTVTVETGVEWGHACDGSEQMCAARCPIEVPVPIETAVPCPNAAHGSIESEELPF